MCFVSAKVSDDPSLLYRESDEAKQQLHSLLQHSFSSYIKARGASQKGKASDVRLAVKGFGLDQIWAQIEHHTEQINAKLINNLTKLMNDEDFLKELAEGNHSTSDELDNSDKNGEGSDD
jgi:hypothetical protein